jgi:phosphoserine phosphatase RsbU/P
MKPLSECRILLVDDVRANLEVLVEGLKGDYKLSLAMNGELALRSAERTPPDLVLLDIQMPGIDGYEVCRRLRSMPETAEVPIIFLSSLEEVQDKARGFELGANDYVTKPFQLLEVKARVRSHLKAKAYADAVKEQIAGDLRVAREIQRGMLPATPAATGLDYGVELAALLEPAREVGGDLYAVLAPAPDRLVLVMGDVSGKGIPAALFMMRTCTLVNLLAKEITEPDRLLARLNDELAADNPSDMFVTLLCGVYHPESRRLLLANAGHCRPVLLRPGRAPTWAVERMGTALGFEPGIQFERTELFLGAGDTLLLYTDGVTEAFAEGDVCYGSDRLLADLAAIAGARPDEADAPPDVPAADLVAGLLERVRAFAAGVPQSDDIALLALRADPSRPPPASLTLELGASVAEVMRCVETLAAFGAAHGLADADLFALTLALEESGTNLVRHGGLDPSAGVRIVLARQEDAFTIELRDPGLPFDPTLLPAPPADGTLDDLADGGWGIQLVRHYMDAIDYFSDGEEQVLRLTRRLGLQRPALHGH